MTKHSNKTILFIGGSSSTSANTVCIRNMAHEMLSRGYRVWVISAGSKYIKTPHVSDSIETWHVQDSLYTRLGSYCTDKPNLLKKITYRIISILRHLLLLPFYPNTSPIRSLFVYKKAKELVLNNHINLVVCVFNSYENINAGIKLKSLLKEQIKIVSYHLDLRTVTINSSSLVRNYVKKHIKESIIKENDIVDLMLIPFSGREEIEKDYKIDNSKIRFVGFPVYVTDSNTNICPLPFNRECINVSYIGTLSRINRNPQLALDILQQASIYLERGIMVHFWGNIGDLYPILQASPIALYHGFIDNIHSKYIMDNSDFLLNIGNSVAYNMLPSKVFSMFATGKPIINVILNPKDSTIPFFQRYDHSVDIHLSNSNEIDIKDVAYKLQRLLKTPFKDANAVFDEFRPSYICDIIIS